MLPIPIISLDLTKSIELGFHIKWTGLMISIPFLTLYICFLGNRLFGFANWWNMELYNEITEEEASKIIEEEDENEKN